MVYPVGVTKLLKNFIMNNFVKFYEDKDSPILPYSTKLWQIHPSREFGRENFGR